MPEPASCFHHLLELGMAEIKYEIAREFGLTDVILHEGWAGVSAKDCGRVGGTIAASKGDRFVRQLARKVAEEGGAQSSSRLHIRRTFAPRKRVLS